MTAHFISQSRDNAVGDGEIPNQAGDDVGALVDWVNQDVSTRSLNADQIRSLIVSETTEDTTSDDLMITQSFRYTESQTTVDSVYPEEAQADDVNPVATGKTMVVTGSTNLRPDDNSITVEVLNADGNSLEISSTDDWATTGEWNTTSDTSNLEPSIYTVESDDGDNTDRAEVKIVEERQTADDGDGTPSFRTFKSHGDIPASAVTDRFGSWNAAVEHAGFEPNTATDKILRSDLVAELRWLRDAVGEIPTGDQMDEHGEYAYITYYERFGS